MVCQLGNCEAHLYMSEGMKELKQMAIDTAKGQQTLENSIVKLTENFSEMQRLNQKLEMIVTSQHLKDAEQDRAISDSRDFINKCIGVMGVLTLLVPVLSATIQNYFK